MDRAGCTQRRGHDPDLQRVSAGLGADVQMIYMPRGDVASTAKQLEALIS